MLDFECAFSLIVLSEPDWTQLGDKPKKKIKTETKRNKKKTLIQKNPSKPMWLLRCNSKVKKNYSALDLWVKCPDGIKQGERWSNEGIFCKAKWLFMDKSIRVTSSTCTSGRRVKSRTQVQML